jgi:hypothetical protein
LVDAPGGWIVGRRRNTRIVRSIGKAVVIYGFDYSDRLLDPMIDAFELLAARRVQLSIREVAIFGPLVHPVHAAGSVFGWEVKQSTAATM